MTPITTDKLKAIIQLAIERFYREGELEVDLPQNPADIASSVSFPGDTEEALAENGGAYVKAWVWVEL